MNVLSIKDIKRLVRKPIVITLFLSEAKDLENKGSNWLYFSGSFHIILGRVKVISDLPRPPLEAFGGATSCT